MNELYKVYRCKKCRKEMILPSEYVEENIKKGKFLVCAYCSHKDLQKGPKGNNIKELMKHSSYKRKNGAIVQDRT